MGKVIRFGDVVGFLRACVAGAFAAIGEVVFLMRGHSIGGTYVSPYA